MRGQTAWNALKYEKNIRQLCFESRNYIDYYYVVRFDWKVAELEACIMIIPNYFLPELWAHSLTDRKSEQFEKDWS